MKQRHPSAFTEDGPRNLPEMVRSIRVIYIRNREISTYGPRSSSYPIIISRPSAWIPQWNADCLSSHSKVRLSRRMRWNVGWIGRCRRQTTTFDRITSTNCVMSSHRLSFRYSSINTRCIASMVSGWIKWSRITRRTLSWLPIDLLDLYGPTCIICQDRPYHAISCTNSLRHGIDNGIRRKSFLIWTFPSKNSLENVTWSRTNHSSKMCIVHTKWYRMGRVILKTHRRSTDFSVARSVDDLIRVGKLSFISFSFK